MIFREKMGPEVDPSNFFRTRTGPEQNFFDPRPGAGQKKGPETRPTPKKRDPTHP